MLLDRAAHWRRADRRSGASPADPVLLAGPAVPRSPHPRLLGDTKAGVRVGERLPLRVEVVLRRLAGVHGVGRGVVVQEAKDRANIPLQGKFHRAILRGLRNIYETP